MRKFRFAVLSDTHIGGKGEGYWHNRLLLGQAGEIAKTALSQIGSHGVEMIFIAGDVAQDGSIEAIEEVKAVLRASPAPVCLVAGNHDTINKEITNNKFQNPNDNKAVNKGCELIPAEGCFPPKIITAFPEQFPEGTGNRAFFAGGIEFAVLDAWCVFDDGSMSPCVNETKVLKAMTIPNQQLIWLEKLLRNNIPDPVIIFTHMPLVPISERLKSTGRKDAGMLANAEEVRSIIRDCKRVIACFSGHQHFNQITVHDGILHCVTSSMIEYPMMYRVVDVYENRLHISTYQVQGTDYPELSFDGAEWVTGEESDRECEFDFSK